MYTLYKRDEGTVPEDLSDILSLTNLVADLFGVLAVSLLEEMRCTEKSGSLTFLSYRLIVRPMYSLTALESLVDLTRMLSLVPEI